MQCRIMLQWLLLHCPRICRRGWLCCSEKRCALLATYVDIKTVFCMQATNRPAITAMTCGAQSFGRLASPRHTQSAATANHTCNILGYEMHTVTVQHSKYQQLTHLFNGNKHKNRHIHPHNDGQELPNRQYQPTQRGPASRLPLSHLPTSYNTTERPRAQLAQRRVSAPGSRS